LDLAGNATSLWVNFTVGYFFDCAIQSDASTAYAGDFLPACGTVKRINADGTAFVAQPSGFAHPVRISIPGAVAPPPQTSAPAAGGGLNSATVPLASGSVVLIAAYGEASLPAAPAAVAAIEQRLEEYVRDLDAKYPRSEVGRMRDGAEAIRTVVGWNSVWDQRVKVVTPVSRTFGPNPYIMWDWDS
jgi:hypothetical protein